MSATREFTPHDGHRPEEPPFDQRARHEAEPDRCTQCGSRLLDGQEWCLRCGSSRTLIYPPPDWRVPVVVVATVLVLAMAGFVFAINRLSDRAGTTAAANAAASLPTPAPLVPAPHARRRTPATAGGTTAAGTTTVSTTGGVSTTTTTTPAGQATSTATSGSTAGQTGATTVAHATRSAAIGSWPVGLSGWTVVLGSYRSESAAYTRAQQIAPTGMTIGVLDSSQHPIMRPGYWVVFSNRYPDRASATAAAQRLLAGGYTTARARQVAPPGGL